MPASDGRMPVSPVSATTSVSTEYVVVAANMLSGVRQTASASTGLRASARAYLLPRSEPQCRTPAPRIGKVTTHGSQHDPEA